MARTLASELSGQCSEIMSPVARWPVRGGGAQLARGRLTASLHNGPAPPALGTVFGLLRAAVGCARPRSSSLFAVLNHM